MTTQDRCARCGNEWHPNNTCPTNAPIDTQPRARWPLGKPTNTTRTAEIINQLITQVAWLTTTVNALQADKASRDTYTQEQKERT